MAGEWSKPIRVNALEGDVANRQAFPRRKGNRGGLGSRRGLGSAGAGHEDKNACEQNSARNHPAIAALSCRLSPQDHISQKARGIYPVCATVLPRRKNLPGNARRKKLYDAGSGHPSPKLRPLHCFLFPLY
jgi:hypothetical protein